VCGCSGTYLIILLAFCFRRQFLPTTRPRYALPHPIQPPKYKTDPPSITTNHPTTQPTHQPTQTPARHKSLGLLAGLLVAPRVVARLSSKIPGPLEGTNALENAASKVTHLAMYGFMALMPATGIAMGYYGACRLFLIGLGFGLGCGTCRGRVEVGGERETWHCDASVLSSHHLVTYVAP
jgi:hypothetical protein